MIDIFKRWFSHSKEQDIDDSQNPWAGLASYEDPETAGRKLKFCGRDDDSYDLARLIMGNVFVTLYGKSGIGKTSLLNAGVFPELREEQYTPVSIRLGMRDDKHPQSYQTMIVEAVERVVKRSETINVIDEQQSQQSIDYLWNYFARHRFYDKDDEPTTPVIVFDQFEEVFRGHRDEAEILLRQLDYLNDKDHTLDSCEVDGQSYRYEQNFRFVVSIREDDLYRLEDSIDNCYLPALKRCRYRLRSLSEKGAKDAILIPGEGLFKTDEKDAIAETIINKSLNDDGSISTNIISLLCSRIFVDFQKSGADHITSGIVDTLVMSNPFEHFYNEVTQKLSTREKQYIKERLVDSTGRRNSVSLTEFESIFRKRKSLFEGKNKIFIKVSGTSENPINRVELIHDHLAKAIHEEKLKTKKKRLFIQSLMMNGVLGSILLAFDFFVIMFTLFTQHDTAVIIWFLLGVIVILSTYFLNIALVHRDRLIIVFSIIVFIISLYLYSLIKISVFLYSFNFYAYHVIKPSLIELSFDIFFWLNFFFVCHSLYIHFFVIIKESNKYKESMKWKDFFSARRKGNRFAQISLLIGFFISIFVIFFTPKTHIERIRELSDNGDTCAMIELGKYYLKYDVDKDMAKEWFNKAKLQGADIDSLIFETFETYDITNYRLTDTMKVEAVNALLQTEGARSLPIINYLIEKDNIYPEFAQVIVNYFDEKKDGNAVMRWKSFCSQKYGKGNLGYEFWRGENVEQDMKRAFELYIKEHSHRNVVICYLNGWGVERNPQKAKDYIRDNQVQLDDQLKLKLQINLLFNQICGN